MKISQLYNEKRLYYLFSLWLITFFFGSKIGALSMGFFTVYPNLVVSLFFIPLIFTSIRKLGKNLGQYASFIWVFILYSLIWIATNERNSFSIFELRSHLFHFLSFLIIVSVYKAYSDKSRFFKILSGVLWLWLFFLILAGAMEIFSGYHFVGHYTEGLMKLPVGVVDVAPVFLYDNPNDYMLNCLGIFFLIVLTDSRRDALKWIYIAVSLILLLYSVYCSARIASIILFLYYLFWLYQYYLKSFVFYFRNNGWLIVGFLLSFGLLLIWNPIFYGRNLNDPEIMLNGVTFVKEVNGKNVLIEGKENLSEREKREFTDLLQNKRLKPGENSSDLRMKLIKNGLFLIKAYPVFGVGPGQIQYHNQQKLVPNDVGTNYSPHNYYIEVIANYGILGWLFFLYLGSRLLRLFIRKKLQKNWLVLTFILFGMLAILPSAFIYQPINWLFVSVWMLCYTNELEETSGR